MCVYIYIYIWRRALAGREESTCRSKRAKKQRESTFKTSRMNTCPDKNISEVCSEDRRYLLCWVLQYFSVSSKFLQKIVSLWGVFESVFSLGFTCRPFQFRLRESLETCNHQKPAHVVDIGLVQWRQARRCFLGLLPGSENQAPSRPAQHHGRGCAACGLQVH